MLEAQEPNMEVVAAMAEEGAAEGAAEKAGEQAEVEAQTNGSQTHA